MFTTIRGLKVDVQLNIDTIEILAILGFRTLVEQKLNERWFAGECEDEPTREEVEAAITYVQGLVTTASE